ncbi:hemolymph lipopolysaccharide-binding protein [Cryptotermes secundus]|uniref:hemolymph lipopolysaccharide-binding protein n=1 Tax=Cryptotermes secundus TaxID=105785 RepID=UPI000CD7DA7B|nr:hemolymph lipopolysaccharide-binding protein [Cryptotermes secundus]
MVNLYRCSMVPGVLLAFAILLSVCASEGGKCIETRSSSMKFSILSHRNKTGHWIAQVGLQHGGNEADKGPSWEVDLEHTVTSCDSHDSIDIKATLTAPPDLPTPGYELFPLMGYYKFHPIGLTWRDALRVCAQEGAHLAVINSQEEANLIKSLYDLHPKVQNSADNNNAFLGYHDFYIEGQFETIFGQSLNTTGYKNFTPGQPNNAPVGTDPEQDCGGVTRAGLLNDLPCNSRYAFFCEMELPK